jgi:uncharacterized membrane protein YiaA
VGLRSATLAGSQKGHYGIPPLLSLFGGAAVQENIRHLALFWDEVAPVEN